MPLPLRHELMSEIERVQARWEVAPNIVTGLTDEQRRTLLGVVFPAGLAAEVMAASAAAAAPPAAAPPAFDWRNVGGKSFVTAVKDQLNCGACVSFTCCAALESMVQIKKALVSDLSEADLHFCSAHGASCSGWWPSLAMNELMTRGTPDDACFPYATAFDALGNPSCKIGTNRDQRAFKITGSTVLTTMSQRKAWLSTNGPVAAAFHVYDDFFAYKSGVYRHVTGNHAGYHAVEVVGYSDVEGCWIAKNSWSASWGDAGFFKIAYGQCGIDETSTDTDPNGTVNKFPMYGINDVVLPVIASRWSGWQSLAGGLSAAPAVASWGPSRLDVFIRGMENALWHRPFNGSWGAWENLAGGLMGAPAAVSWGPGRIDVFARGFDNALWHRSFEGGWSQWESLGGVLTSDPAVASWGPNRLDVFVRGLDNALYRLWFDGVDWNGWEHVGGGLSAAPAAVSRAEGRIDVFVRGIENALWHRPFSNNAWGTWANLGGGLNSSPAAASWGPNRMDVFVRGMENALWSLTFDNGWRQWENLGGVIMSAPAAVSSDSERLDVFACGTDNALWHKAYA